MNVQKGTALLGLCAGAMSCFSQGPTPTPAPPIPAAANPGAIEVGKPFSQAVAGTTAALDMVAIPPGKGSDSQLHGPFWISKTEVLWDHYDVFVYGLDQPPQTDGAPLPTPDGVTRPTKPYLTMDRGFGHAGYPAISVSHKGAEEFCKWLSAKTGRKYRLPTESEWEYVALAGADEKIADLEEQAWHKGNADAKTQPGATKRPNRWGVHDMFGNAREWVIGRDGKPVTKGGSYRDKPETISAKDRVENKPSWNATDPQIPKSVWWLADGGFIGFRIVCEGEAK